MSKFDLGCTYCYVKIEICKEQAKKKLKGFSERFIRDESGMEVIAIMLILVILLGLVLTLKNFINNIADSAMDYLEEETVSVEENVPSDPNDPTNASNYGGGGSSW